MLRASNTDRLSSVLLRAKVANAFIVPFLLFLITVIQATTALSQIRTYPQEIRGYKVERTVVEVKKPQAKNAKSGNAGTEATNNSAGPPNQDSQGEQNSDSDADALIRFGKPELARVTPLGITFAVPIVVSPVTQSGHVDFLVFEDMVFNGTSVEIDEYRRPFDLPNKEPLTLNQPVRVYIYLPSAMLAAIGEWSDSKETWPVTGRIYVFGKFKKAMFSFKRCIPVELKVTMPNPLKDR
jgi:hypothetical protein